MRQVQGPPQTVPGLVALTKRVCYPMCSIPPWAHILYANDLRASVQRDSHHHPCRLALGCPSAPPTTQGYPQQLSLRGKSEVQVLTCAGQSLREWRSGQFTRLRYYRETPLLEESMASSKSSCPLVHHGCRAIVTIHQGRVDRVAYRFVPRSVNASDHCEEVFARCQE